MTDLEAYQNQLDEVRKNLKKNAWNAATRLNSIYQRTLDSKDFDEWDISSFESFLYGALLFVAEVSENVSTLTYLVDHPELDDEEEVTNDRQTKD